MSFASRMTAETGAPQPRWLYLLRKVTDTTAIAFAIWNFSPLNWEQSAWVAFGLYVGIGIVSWVKRHGVVGGFGPGSTVGDILYHSVFSAVPVALVGGFNGGIDLLLLGSLVLCFWVLEGAGYGPVRPD